MSSAETNAETYYNSSYTHGVDEKRRVQIPAKWRPATEETKLTLMLWKKGGEERTCILVLPPEIMKSLADKLKAMPFSDPNAEALRRFLGTNSDQVSMDKGGRICIPDGMAKAAGIEKEAIFIGMIDRFQIWNPQRYQPVGVKDETLSDTAIDLI